MKDKKGNVPALGVGSGTSLGPFICVLGCCKVRPNRPTAPEGGLEKRIPGTQMPLWYSGFVRSRRENLKSDLYLTIIPGRRMPDLP